LFAPLVALLLALLLAQNREFFREVSLWNLTSNPL
jgi:hypothetical protein